LQDPAYTGQDTATLSSARSRYLLAFDHPVPKFDIAIDRPATQPHKTRELAVENWPQIGTILYPRIRNHSGQRSISLSAQRGKTPTNTDHDFGQIGRAFDSEQMLCPGTIPVLRVRGVISVFSNSLMLLVSSLVASCSRISVASLLVPSRLSMTPLPFAVSP